MTMADHHQNEALAFIGLGNIGKGIARNLILADGLRQPISIYNRTPAKAKRFLADLPDAAPAVVVHDTLADAVKDRTIVFWCLSDDSAVQSLVSQLVELDIDIKDKLFVDCSTIHPHTTAQVCEAVQKQGAHYVAMPVFGAPAAAQAGMLVPVLAGPQHLVERVKPFTVGVTSKALIDMPDQPPSQASKMKLVGNAMVFGMIESIAQGHVLAEKSGVGRENLHKFIDNLWGGVYSAYSNRMMSGDYYKREEPLFAAPLAIKDINHAKTLAPGSEQPTLDVALGHLQKVAELAKERGDVAGIYGAVRVLSGLPYENNEA